jgi:uncharacterized RDD family membrane protein YckC
MVWKQRRRWVCSIAMSNRPIVSWTLTGTVKVGDFGLSISTTVRGDSHLTTPGSFLGTPAFSSPEQLRGDELDVRSDIYAVGVTLFYLLTGRTPYEADNLVKLLATVLEKPAPSPLSFRKEIPRGLASAIQRCLAKQPSDRFKTYADLREALLPYNSTAPTPATLARRFAAGVCDQIIWMIPVMSIQLAVIRGDFSRLTDPALFRSPVYLACMFASLLAYGLYYAIPEGLWGASLGKAICRLRVVDRSRNRIGVPRAMVRTGVYIVFPSLILWVYTIFAGRFPFDIEHMGENPWLAMLVSYSYYVLLALLFCTARRRNGYSGLHDLAVDSRVILRAAYQSRPRMEMEVENLPDVDGAESVGLYRVLDTLDSNDSGQFLLGYDLRLLRRVWIHRTPVGSPSVPIERRSMGRVGRLRWINGRRDDDESWDVYEALPGRPMLKLIDRPQPWSIVRYWLLDLAQELRAASKDGTLPPTLALDRLWITVAGRVKLLDFSAPGTSAMREVVEPAPPDPALSGSAVDLHRVAVAALHDAPDAKPLPIDARELLNRLPSAESLDDVCDDLKRLVKKSPTVTRLRRFAMLCAAAGFPLLMGVLTIVGVLLTTQWNQQHPGISELRYCLMLLDQNVYQQIPRHNDTEQRPSPEVEREALETYIAGKFRPVITDRRVWFGFMGLTIPQPHRKLAEQIIADRPAVSDTEFADAEATIEPVLDAIAQQDELFQQIPPLAVGAMQFLGMWLVFVTLPGLIATIAFRRGIIMLAFGVDCVTRVGVLASRLRMLWRWLVFNAPVLLAPVALALLVPSKQTLTPSLLAISGVLVLIALWSLLLPTRGMADRLSGTFPVPR